MHALVQANCLKQAMDNRTVSVEDLECHVRNLERNLSDAAVAVNMQQNYSFKGPYSIASECGMQ